MHAHTIKKVSFLLDDPRIKEVDIKGYTASATKGSLSATILCVTAHLLFTLRAVWLQYG